MGDRSVSGEHGRAQRHHERSQPAEEPEYIVRLVRRVVTVSVETVRLVGELAATVDVLAAVGVKETVEQVAE